MLHRYLQVALILSAILCTSILSAQSGRVVVDGKAYTVHQVRMGETFYSISQAYKVHVDSLRSVNRLVDETAALHPGDMLIVPLYAVKTEHVHTPLAAPIITATAPPTNSANNSAHIQHVVKTGETLYSVARLYPHTTVAAIKELNNLEVEGLNIGQILLIPTHKPAPAPPVAPKTVAPPVGQLVIDSNALYRPSGNHEPMPNPNDAVVNDNDDNATMASFDLKMLAELEGKFKTNAATNKTETVKGTATWMDDPSTENQQRFYAMHKTAPIGSVVMVKNLMNNRIVYAKVIGKLPSNKSNENIIVRVSGGAARYLNVLDDRFMVELSLPQGK